MATQNLVSGTIAPETKADILEKIEDIRRKLGFLVSLTGSDIQSLIKAGNSCRPFLEMAYAAIDGHPAIMSPLFNFEEYKKDFQLAKDLTVISSEVNQLAESLTTTLVAVNSDIMNASLEIYAAVKQNSDRVPGLSVAASEMAGFFRRPKKKTV